MYFLKISEKELANYWQDSLEDIHLCNKLYLMKLLTTWVVLYDILFYFYSSSYFFSEYFYFYLSKYYYKVTMLLLEYRFCLLYTPLVILHLQKSYGPTYFLKLDAELGHCSINPLKAEAMASKASSATRLAVLWLRLCIAQYRLLYWFIQS